MPNPTRILAVILLGLTLLAPTAHAQMSSREGIALQNQLLELRRDLDQLRRGGSSLGAPAVAPPPRGAVGGGEVVGQLVARIAALEEEVRSLRGRAQEAEYRNQQLAQDIEKLRGDLEFRLDALEGGRGGARPQQRGDAGRPQPQPLARQPQAGPQHAAANTPRPPERALSEGQAALRRRDYAAAEAAAREVIASRNQARAQDAQLLLGDALAGRRQFQNAALAYDEAYRRNRRSGRAPEALLGLATSFSGFNARREACDTLGQLRSEFPRLSRDLTQQADTMRRSNGCR